MEDDPLQSNTLRRILEREGFAVEQAFDARSALERLLQMDKLDCMILDVMLPVKGAFNEPKGGMEAGIKILQLVRENVQFEKWQESESKKKLPVICHTVRSVDRKVRKELEKLGGEVIAKGDRPESLLDSLRQMIEE